MIMSYQSGAHNPRGERRPSGKRPAYLNPDVLNRVAAEGDARLVARVRKQRGE
ncbi:MULTISPECIES: hypothetical protein [Pseudomonas]|nr:MULTISPECIES: hypothetical protein [Pseudomonas]MBI6913266.1 hypothetical protein [Pseudomonas juntendi]MDH1548610.1 hypothetical protein [Pseudomonas juntendi]ULL06628.1 hypothetical protein JNO42_06310 [Pseudomonas putida]